MTILLLVWTWLRGHWRVVVLAAVIGLALLLAFCRAKPNPIPPKETKSLDSLDATKPTHDSVRKVVTDSATRVVTRIVHDSAAAVKARAEAERYRAVADSALAVARAQHDTTSAAFVAADNATREAYVLRASNDTLSKRLAEAHGTIVLLTQQVTRDSIRQRASDDLNARLANDVKTAGRCTWAYVFGCPSRKVVLVAGIAAGAVGTYALDHRK